MEFLGYALLILYFFLIIYVSKGYLNYIRDQKVVFKVILIFSCFLPAFVLLYIMSDENYIYYYDFSNYWIKTIKYNDIIDEKGFRTIQEVIKSINHDIYNDLAAIPLTLFCKVFGFDFKYFVFGIYMIFALPTAILFSNLVLIISKNPRPSFLIIPFFILIFIPLLFPLRFGFVEIAALVPIGIILNLYFKSDFLNKIEVKRFILIGVLLLVLLITRRYFTFWFISFFITNAVIVFAGYVASSRNSKVLKRGFLNLFIAGISTIILMLIFFYPFFKLNFLTDYKDLYSGFRVRDWSGHWKNFIHYFGYFSLLIILIGSVGFIKKKLYSVFAFLIMNLLFIAIYFVSYNDFGAQHYYNLIPFILMLMFGIFLIENKKYRFTAIAVSGLLLGINFYLNAMTPKTKSFDFFSNSSIYTQNRGDYEQLGDIIEDIKSNYRNGFYTYCLSSSEVLNVSALQNYSLPKNMISSPGLLQTQTLDKRDMFPNDLFFAKYILTTIPVQHNLKAEDQQVIVYFNNEFLNGKFKNHFIVEKNYTLNNGVKAILLKRIKGFSETEINEIRNHFQNKYAEYPNMYDVKSFYLQSNSIKVGKIDGNIKQIENDLIIMPGSDSPSEVSFDLDSLKTYNIRFNASFRNKSEIMENCNPENDGEIYLNVYLDDQLLNKSYLTHRKDSVFEFNIKHTKEIRFNVDKGKNKNWCDYFQLSELKIIEE